MKTAQAERPPRRPGVTPVTETERTLPYNLEAERSILGAILVHDDAFDTAVESVSAAAFFRQAHREIFDAMRRLREAGQRVDFVTLKDELVRTGKLDDIGGPSYITGLADGVPRTTNVRAYAQIVREKCTLREIIYIGNQALSAAYDAESTAAEILRQADAQLLDLYAGQRRGHLIPLKDRITALTQELEYRVAHRGELRGVDTGWTCVNEMTLGWRPTELIIIAARPSIGKSTVLLNTLTAAAKTGKRAGLFTFEMAREELEDRLLASLSGVPLTRIAGGFFSEAEYIKLSEALELMHGLPLWIDDTPSQTIHDVRAACRRAQAEGGLDIVGIDYVQLIPGSLERKDATRNDELTDVSRRTKELAMELRIPVVLLSQLKRLESSKGSSVKPKLEDLRDCGALEQDANTVILLHRKNHRESGTTEVILEKQRNGPTGTVNLDFDRDTSTFRDITLGAEKD